MRRLILAPHIDDEVLGCFAFLSADAHVLFAGVEDRPSTEVRKAEVAASASQLGFAYSMLDNPVNNFAAAELIGSFEEAINRLKPHTVLIPDSSYNQDHRAVFDAGIVATRPHDQNWFVPEVLVYEQPHSVVWPSHRAETPNVFHEIDIEAKLHAYSLYGSQVRGHRSPETVRALAALRGSHIGVAHAEAFHARRIVLGDS